MALWLLQTKHYFDLIGQDSSGLARNFGKKY